VDDRPDGVQPLYPASGTGCSEHAGGVQPAQPRGAAVAPEPSMEPSREPSAARARGREALLAAQGSAVGAGRAGEFFEALGPAWRLTAAQWARLTPAVLAALDDGWTPHGLAGFTGVNTDGVRNPYAVLAARLSSAELPPPARRRAPRPPWCGECDQNTRMLGFDGDAPRPCPRCKQAITASRAIRNATGPGLARANGTPHAHLSPSVRPADAVCSPEFVPNADSVPGWPCDRGVGNPAPNDLLCAWILRARLPGSPHDGISQWCQLPAIPCAGRNVVAKVWKK
jgi:hypothetical protein